MKSYLLPSRFFKKQWIWFEDPHDVTGVDQVMFFSYNDLSVPGFAKSSGSTSVIDVTKPLEELWEAMRKDFIRLQIERGRRQGIEVRLNDNFGAFQNILEEFRRTKGLEQQDYRVLREHGTLISAYLNGNMIAGGIFIEDEKHVRVWMLASKRLDDKALKQRVGEANRMIIWEAIQYAKRTGKDVFDFCGLDMPRHEGDSLSSLTAYKEAFGGKRCDQHYYTKVYSPVLRLWMRVRPLFR
jgi:hypothetical protein